jgi:hypothetical protein
MQLPEDTVTLQVGYRRWRLDTPDDLWIALKKLTAKGFDGHVRTKRDAAGVVVWDLEVNNTVDSQDYVVATLGWVLVLLGDKLQSMSASDYSAFDATLTGG